jgi:hypothetical protein
MSDRGITKGRDLYLLPSAVICPACHGVMRATWDMKDKDPVAFLKAECQTPGCRLFSTRYKFPLPLVSAEEMKPGE